MRCFEQDQPPIYFTLESELFISDLLQLQLYKTSQSIRVISLHLISIQEVKKTDVFPLFLWFVMKRIWNVVWNHQVFHFAWHRLLSQRLQEFYWRNEHFLEIYLTSVMFVGNNSQTNKTSRLVLTLKSNPSSPYPSISKHAKQDPL